MPVLGSPDLAVGIACTLPVLEMADRLDLLQDLVADGLDDTFDPHGCPGFDLPEVLA